MTSPRIIIEAALEKLPVTYDHAIDNSYVVVSWKPPTASAARSDLRKISAAMNAIGYRRYLTAIKRRCAEVRYAPKGYKPTNAPTDSLAANRELTEEHPDSLATWTEIHVIDYARRADESLERARIRALKAWRRGEIPLVVTRLTTRETVEVLTPDRIDWSTLPKAPSGTPGKTIRLTKATEEALRKVVPSKYESDAKAVEALVLAGVR